MWYAILLAGAIGLDQLLKWWVTSHLEVGQSAPLLPGVVQLTRLHNTGAAWSSFSGKTGLLAAVTVVLLAAVVYLVVKKIVRHPLGLSAAMLVLGGGIGNMIDRLLYGYVIDYVDFYPLPFWTWVFNLADAAICAGVVLFAVYLLFFEKKAKAAGKKAFFDDAPKKSPDGDSR